MTTQFSDLVGKTLTNIEVNDDNDNIIWTCSDGTQYLMYHNQDCCESVNIEDIVGNLEDLLNSPVLLAYESTNKNDPKLHHDDEWLWTFYNISTNKGSVTLRWYGESNGYYSVDVNFEKFRNSTN